MLQGLIWGLISYLFRYFQFRATLRESRIDSMNSSNIRAFTYQGKIYDRDMFILLYMEYMGKASLDDIQRILEGEEKELSSSKRGELADAILEALQRLGGRRTGPSDLHGRELSEEKRKRQWYTIWEKTPLAWHKFASWVALPLGVLVGFGRLVTFIETMGAYRGTDAAILAWVDVLGTAAAIVAGIVAIIGMHKRRWFGPCAYIASYLMACGYAVFCIALGVAYQTGGNYIATNLGQAISTGVVGLLVMVYYKKRRTLFGPVPVMVGSVVHQVTSTSEEESAARSVGGYSTVYREVVRADMSEDVERIATATMEPHNDIAEDSGQISAKEMLVELLAQKERQVEERAGLELNTTGMVKTGKGSAPVWSVVMLGALCVTLTIAAVVMGCQWQKAVEQRDASSALVMEVMAKVDAKNDDIALLEKNNKRLQTRLEEQKEEYNDVLRQYVDIYRYKAVLNERIGFIVSGSKYYHTIDCEIYQNSSKYWAHNVEYCESLGYSECPTCIQGESKFRTTDDLRRALDIK